MEVPTEIARETEPGPELSRLAFGEVTVDVESRHVRTATDASRLEPRVCDLLRTLVARPGLTVSRGHLIETVWGQDEGSAGTLSQAVSALRRALGDDDRAPRFIETVPGLGYRWIFEEPSERRGSPSPRWLGRVWAAGGAALAAVVGGLDGIGARAPSSLGREPAITLEIVEP